MKKSEIALIIVIIAISATATYFLGSALLGQRVLQPVDIEKVQLISSDLAEPSELVFNAEAINPTIQVRIGDGNNQQPF